MDLPKATNYADISKYLKEKIIFKTSLITNPLSQRSSGYYIHRLL